MDKLRLTLLIVGCFIVLGIYLWEIFSKTNSKKQTAILDDIPLAPLNNEVDDHAEAMVDLGGLLNRSKDQASVENILIEPLINQKKSNDQNDTNDESLLTTLMNMKDHETKPSENSSHYQFPEVGEKIQGNKDEITLNQFDHNDSLLEENQNTEDMIVLYITSPEYISFNGLSISKAADVIGMIYGHMNIFHHFGPAELHSGQPLFSTANMYEPGTFDLGRMADLNTKGIVMFMYSPASIDACAIFELYLNTTQRMANLLDGDVRTSDNKILSTISINELRDKAAFF